MAELKVNPYIVKIFLEENPNLDISLREGNDKEVMIKASFESWPEAIFEMIDALRATGFHIPSFETEESKNQFVHQLEEQYFRY